MINHIVLFKTKCNAKLDSILEQEFFNLKNNIPEIKSITGGNNISKEEFDKGFNKGFILQFENESNLQKYLISKEHKYFVRTYVENTIEDVFVFDYIE